VGLAESGASVSRVDLLLVIGCMLTAVMILLVVPR